MLWFDPRYFVVTLPAFLLALWAQRKVRSTFHRYAQVPNARHITGLDAAHTLMWSERLTGLAITEVPGELTDFYDPSDRSLNLSESSTRLPSVGALAVVAHELGHAAQDRDGYVWLRARSGLVGVAQVGSNLGVWLFVIGMLFGAAGNGSGFGFAVAFAGLILFTGAVVFTLLTLPVELNASRRARAMLVQNGLITVDEQQAVAAVLTAAALTYVAAAAQALAQLMYFAFLLFGGRRHS